MLCRSEIILSDLDVHSHFREEDTAYPDYDNNGKYQMCPISIRIRGTHVSPCQNIQPCNIIGYTVNSFCSLTTQSIQRDKNRENYDSQRYKYEKQRLKVTKEKVGIETTFVDYLAILEFENGEQPTEKTSRRRGRSFSFRDQVGFRFTVRYTLASEAKREAVRQMYYILASLSFNMTKMKSCMPKTTSAVDNAVMNATMLIPSLASNLSGDPSILVYVSGAMCSRGMCGVVERDTPRNVAVWKGEGKEEAGCLDCLYPGKGRVADEIMNHESDDIARQLVHIQAG